MYKTVENWYEPADNLRKKADFICEMDREDHGFLCGMIRQFAPCKVVEIGVAEGGTTAVIANALSMMGGKRRLISVDLNERLFCNTQYQTGYQYEELKQHIDFSHGQVEHQFLLGKTIAGQIQQIGGEIDMAVIDTTHRLPGELLDFLCLLPYMRTGGVILLHDVNLNYFKTFSSDPCEVLLADVRMATKILLSTAKGQKYIRLRENMCMNIGGVVPDEETVKCADDLFMMLTGTWDYRVSAEDLKEYRAVYEKHYDPMALKLFDISVEQNKIIQENKEIAWLEKDMDRISAYLPYQQIPYASNIAIYGADQQGKSLCLWAAITKYVTVTAWVDEDWIKFQNERIQAPHTLHNAKFDYLVIAADSEEAFAEKKRYILENKLALKRQIVRAQTEEGIPVKELCRPKYHLPYSKIPAGTKICLYGAGGAGKDIYRSVRQSQYCEIVGWVDTYRHNGSDCFTEAVKSPGELAQMEFDCIVVCVTSGSVYEEIKNQLEHNGWNKGKRIIWLF